MNDTGNIRFDTTTVRGFAEYLHHLWETKYMVRKDEVAAQLQGGKGGDAYAHSSASGSMGTSGIDYMGLEIGKAEVENAEAGRLALDQYMDAWQGMAYGGAYAAEEFDGQDGKNAEGMEEGFSKGDDGGARRGERRA